MVNYNNSDSTAFDKIVNEITAELKRRQRHVLEKFSIIKGKNSSIHSFHGTIGNNKARNLDLVHGNWTNHEEYIASWLMGLKDLIATGQYTIMKEMIKIENIREYVLLFLERDFYRHYKVRIREKPQENLWSIWFGRNNLFWGLLISPRLEDENWENKPADIRKVKFNYWTIDHIRSTGLIDPENNQIIKFKNIDDFLIFYESILKRISNSTYEKHVYDFYCDYIRSSPNPCFEPLLIPEFRYEGINQKHKYRLDFIILNSHTGERIGFELSPQSTHMAVNGIKSKTQIEINKELSASWNKEMDKRNSYFQQFGISTITFTDDKLADMNQCCNIIKHYLSKRKPEQKSINELIFDIINT